MSDGRVYCAEECAAAGEPLAGTSVRVDVWLLLEYKPSWKRKAVTDNALSDAMARWLDGTLAALAASGPDETPLVVRPQFIRRPEIDTDQTTVMLARDGTLWRYAAKGYDAIQELDLTAPERAMRTERAPQYFVCTNGQRDLCCARFGLPAYARLRELVGARAWQTTHVGGHRFAPNVLTLPQAALYGRVTPEAADDFVADVEAGRLATSLLRGRSVYAPSAQFAEALLPAGAMPAKFAGIDGTRVTFHTDTGKQTLDIAPTTTPIEILPSCGAQREVVYPLEVR